MECGAIFEEAIPTLSLLEIACEVIVLIDGLDFFADPCGEVVFPAAKTFFSRWTRFSCMHASSPSPFELPDEFLFEPDDSPESKFSFGFYKT